MESKYDKSREWWSSLSDNDKSIAFYNYSGKSCKSDIINLIEEMYNEQKNVSVIVDADEVRKKYSLVIADIYAEHHVSAFTDIEKHNEDIIKAMVDFAIFYKENS